MKKDLSYLVFVMDRSGSMAGVWDDAVGGFKQFLSDQKKEPGEARLMLVAFDDKYDVVCDLVPIRDVPDDVLVKHEIAPRGNTALNDAVGRTISALGAKMAALPEDERPEHVIFAVMTDGLNNASREFSKDKVKEMVEHQTAKYGWIFMFLGANVDAFAESIAYGIPVANAVAYAASAVGTRASYSGMSANVCRSRRGMSKGAFTSEERKAAADSQPVPEPPKSSSVPKGGWKQ
jgi:uncharacterized protein YegL